ncbi:hypothetical protein, partial [Aeromonas veronii]|uniref:hypothetical protein n=1 Tax=Aeromonas veronii TaxID=654 RepID=UPI0038B56539
FLPTPCLYLVVTIGPHDIPNDAFAPISYGWRYLFGLRTVICQGTWGCLFAVIFAENGLWVG